MWGMAELRPYSLILDKILRVFVLTERFFSRKVSTGFWPLEEI